MTDRLAEIKRDREDFKHVMPVEDIDWLILEVERLRDKIAQTQDIKRVVEEMQAQHARDLKTALANKEIRP